MEAHRGTISTCAPWVRRGPARPACSRGGCEPSGSRWASVCFIQCSSSRRGWSSRKCAPRLSVRARALTDRGLGQVEQVAQLERLGEVVVEDVALVVHRDVLEVALELGDGRSAWASDSSVRKTMAFSVISSWRASRMSATRLSPVPLLSCSIRSRTSASGSLGSSAKSTSPTYSAMCLPPRRPNTTMSSSELVPRRLAPCTETHAHSPAAYSPGDRRVVGVDDDLGVDVGGDAAHGVVGRRLDRDGLGLRLDALVGAHEVGDVRQLGVDLLGRRCVRSRWT